MDLITNCVRLNGRMFYARYRDLVTEYTLVRTAGVGEKNRDDKGAAAQCWILVSGHWSLVAGIVNSEPDLLIHGFCLYS